MIAEEKNEFKMRAKNQIQGENTCAQCILKIRLWVLELITIAQSI